MYFRKILKAASFIQCLPLPPAPPPSLKDLGTSIKTEIKKHSFYQPSERAHKEHHPDRCWVVVVMVCFICICPGGGSDGEESACNAGDSGSIPGLGRSLHEEGMATTPGILLPGEFHGQRSLAGYSLWGLQRARHDWTTNTPLHTHTENLLLAFFFKVFNLFLWIQKLGDKLTFFLLPTLI